MIKSIYQDPAEGLKQKRQYDRDIGLHEPFLEAVPTTLVLTVMFLRGVRASHSVEDDNETLERIVLGEDHVIFYVCFLLSIFSASFGVAKCLKTGVGRSLGFQGPLDGFCSLRFLTAFLACASCLVVKGAFLSSAEVVSIVIYTGCPNIFHYYIFQLFRNVHLYNMYKIIKSNLKVRWTLFDLRMPNSSNTAKHLYPSFPLFRC